MTTYAPEARVHRPHINWWLVAVIGLAAALIGLGAWVLVDRYTGPANDAATLIDDLNTAFTTNDAEAIPSYYASDAVVRSLGDEYAGVDAIRSMAVGTFQVERVAPVTVEGDFATTFNRLSGGDQATIAVTTYEIQDGKVIRQWSFAVGKTPPFDNAVQ